MFHEACTALVGRLSGYDRAVEVGVGNRPDVARRLSERGVRVVATDVREREVPPGVDFAVDDITDPDPARYREAGVVYALNCPPELQRPLVEAARIGGADCCFTTLGGDPAVVPATAETIPGETLFRARTDGPGVSRSDRRPVRGGERP